MELAADMSAYIMDWNWLSVLAFLTWTLAEPVAAHDWYADRTDPVTTAKCCDGKDCYSLDPSEVTALTGGDYIATIWKWRIPRERVQESVDDGYHICIVAVPANNPAAADTETLRYWTCFFAPSGVSAIH